MIAGRWCEKRVEKKCCLRVQVANSGRNGWTGGGEMERVVYDRSWGYSDYQHHDNSRQILPSLVMIERTCLIIISCLAMVSSLRITKLINSPGDFLKIPINIFFPMQTEDFLFLSSTLFGRNTVWTTEPVFVNV